MLIGYLYNLGFDQIFNFFWQFFEFIVKCFLKRSVFFLYNFIKNICLGFGMYTVILRKV